MAQQSESRSGRVVGCFSEVDVGEFLARVIYLPADSLPTTNVNGLARWAGGARRALRAVVRNACSVNLDMMGFAHVASSSSMVWCIVQST